MSSRIDWRNYDYSDGPPKTPSPSNVPSTASVASSHTRDTNPYSKSFPIRRSSPTNDYDDMGFRPIQPSHNRRLPSPTEQLGSTGQPKLTYRPPSSSTQQSAFRDFNKVSPMDPVKSPTSSVDQNFTGDIPLKNKHVPSVKQNETQLKKSFSEEAEEDFNEVWDKAESEWKEAEADQRIISDDEEDANFVNGGSVASFANMDVMSHVQGTSTTRQSPVSILRNRSDTTSSLKLEDDDSSYNSAKRRKHPWDKDFKEEANGHDGPLDERSLYSDDDEVEEEEEDKTNLDQYEANPDDIAGMDDDEAVILKHEQYKMQQQQLQKQQQQQQKLKYPYHNSVDSDVMESKNRRRKSRQQDFAVEDEEDSIAQVYGDVDETVAIDLLQNRTKQAWSKRNQAAASSVQPVSNGTDSRKALVSFQKNTVHEFEPDERNEDASEDSEEATEYTEDDTYYDDDTYAGRSMHSVYTKSYESEAEDLVKDLFLWGSGKATNPGRRELKYKKGYKEKYKNVNKRDSYDDGTLEDEQTIEDESTLEGSSLVSYQNSKRRSNKPAYDDDTFDGSKVTLESLDYSEMGEDGWSMTYNYCEDLLTMIGSVCGIRSVTASKPETESSEKELTPVESTPAQAKEDDNDIQSTLENWLDYAADLLFDTSPTDNLAAMDSATKQALMTLSVNAARTKHQLNNCNYYNANNLDLNKDIKIITIKVGLPIGVVFEESPVACWVKRIFPNGNVAKRSSGGKIEEGDQLASINGNSAIQKNVAEVCKILANTPNPESIDLCFIRYIGTIQSAPDNQGYEAIDPKINTKSVSEAVPMGPSKKFSFGRAKSAPSANDFHNSSQIPVKKSNSTFSFGKTKQDRTKPNANVSPTNEKKKKKKLFGFLRKKKNKSKS